MEKKYNNDPSPNKDLDSLIEGFKAKNDQFYEDIDIKALSIELSNMKDLIAKREDINKRFVKEMKQLEVFISIISSKKSRL